jgi:hypothetical protein
VRRKTRREAALTAACSPLRGSRWAPRLPLQPHLPLLDRTRAPAAARLDALDGREGSTPTVPPVSKVFELAPPAPGELNLIEIKGGANRRVLGAVARASVTATATAPAAARPDARTCRCSTGRAQWTEGQCTDRPSGTQGIDA